jgi:integrase
MKKYNIEKKIDGKKITLHSLRHTYATRCIESGMPVKVLQHRLGHVSIIVTYNTYADVFDPFEEAAIETADKYLADKGVQMGYSTPNPPKK